MTSTEKGEKKKGGLSRLLGKRDKTPERPTTLPDSAYASSDTPSAEPTNQRSTPDMVPAEKNSEIGNIDKDKNLALKPSTGEVFDQDTGEVVTVVTTTTTTTTTTTKKPGHKNVDTKQDIQRDIHHGESVPTGPSEMPANSTVVTTGAPDPIHTDPQSSHLSPPIPVKSNKRENRKSAEIPSGMDYSNAYDAPPPGTFRGTTGTPPPGSPTRHNFSYPQRTGQGPTDTPSSGLRTADHPMHHDRGTMQDLRLAAKGIHGVGETLRGTLNSTIDRRFQPKDAEKAAAINAKNEAVLMRGRNEMEGLNRNRRSHSPNYNPNMNQNINPRTGPNTQYSPPPPSHSPPNVTGPGTETADRKLSDPPGAWPNSADEHEEENHARKLSRDKEKASTIGKLFSENPLVDNGKN